jgi:hypothetical protein
LLAHLTILGAIHRKSRTLAQSGSEIVRQTHFIFHDEDAHLNYPPAAHLKGA